MAFNDGKYLHGRIGNLIHKKWRGKQIVQMKTMAINQSAATKKTAGVFGKASTLSKEIRNSVSDLYKSNYDGAMINRFTTQNAALLRHCYDPETNTYTFKEDSFSRLNGFEFNLKSPLADSLWLQPEISLTENTLLIALPEFAIPDQLKFPVLANTCNLTCFVTLYALQAHLRHNHQPQILEISNTQSIVPAQQWTYDVPEGCLAVVSMGLEFYNLNGNIKTVINSKTFNPAGICGALYHPGICTVEEKTNPSNNWKRMNVGFDVVVAAV